MRVSIVNVDDKVARGRPRKMWDEVGQNHLQDLGLHREAAGN